MIIPPFLLGHLYFFHEFLSLFSFSIAVSVFCFHSATFSLQCFRDTIVG